MSLRARLRRRRLERLERDLRRVDPPWAPHVGDILHCSIIRSSDTGSVVVSPWADCGTDQNPPVEYE